MANRAPKVEICDLHHVNRGKAAADWRRCGGSYEMVIAKPLSSEPCNVSVAKIHRDEARTG